MDAEISSEIPDTSNASKPDDDPPKKRGRGRPKKGTNPPPKAKPVKIAPRNQRKQIIRNIRKPSHIPVDINTKQWTVQEKKDLALALTKCSPSAYEELSEKVRSRSPREVEHFLNRVTKCLEWRGNKKLHVPLTSWIVTGRDLVRVEQKDYTESLSTVTSIISNYEDHPKPSSTVPDYSAIYGYLSLILQGKELPVLGALESAVVLDLMHNLVEVLRTHDTEEQRRIMKMKSHMLNQPIEENDGFKFVQTARKALMNDFSDFDPPGTSSSVSSITKGTQAAKQSQSEKMDSNNKEAGQSAGQGISCNDSQEQHVSENESNCATQENEAKIYKAGIKRKVKLTDEEDIPPKKPSLFTLNPFCVPVNLLRLKPKIELCKKINQVYNRPRVLIPAAEHKKKPAYMPQNVQQYNTIHVSLSQTGTLMNKEYLLHPHPKMYLVDN